MNPFNPLYDIVVMNKTFPSASTTSDFPEPYDVIPNDVIAVYSVDGTLGTRTADATTMKTYTKSEADINTGKYRCTQINNNHRYRESSRASLLPQMSSHQSHAMEQAEV